MNRVTRFTSWAVVAGLAVGAASVQCAGSADNVQECKPVGHDRADVRSPALQPTAIRSPRRTSRTCMWRGRCPRARCADTRETRSSIGSTMYLHSSFPNKVYALDLSKPGAPQIWQFTPEQSDGRDRDRVLRRRESWSRVRSEDQPPLHRAARRRCARARCEDGQAGVAREERRLQEGRDDDQRPARRRRRAQTGVSGGEFGVRGRITAFSTQDGKELWRTYSTGPDKDVGITDNTLKSPYPSAQGKDLGVSTWQGDEWQRGGGTTWGWYSYDPALNLFYHGSGNPGTWNPDQRPGDNKWSMSICGAQNPKRVRRVGLPDDAARCSGTTMASTRTCCSIMAARRSLAHFDRNGFGYTLDRTTGKVLVAEAVRSDQLGQERRSDDGPAGRGSRRSAPPPRATPRASARPPLASRISSRRRTRRRLVCSTCRPTTSAWTTRASR